MIEAISGFLLGDKGYLRPWWKTELSERFRIEKVWVRDLWY
jgi:hypothetical protein